MNVKDVHTEIHVMYIYNRLRTGTEMRMKKKILYIPIIWAGGKILLKFSHGLVDPSQMGSPGML
jgi:hypothetical protein